MRTFVLPSLPFSLTNRVDLKSNPTYSRNLIFWELEVIIGFNIDIGYWNCLLELDIGIGCSNYILELDIGIKFRVDNKLLDLNILNYILDWILKKKTHSATDS